MRRLLAAAVLAGAALVAIGCGDDDADTRSATTATETAAETEPKIPPTPTPVAKLTDRLEAAGYTVGDEDLGTDRPRPLGVLTVPVAHGEGRVRIFVHRSAAEVARFERPFVSIERDLPEQFELRNAGALLFVGTIEEPAVLPMDEFNEIVAAATE